MKVAGRSGRARPGRFPAAAVCVGAPVIDLVVGVVEAFVLAGIVGALHMVTSGIIHLV